MNKNNNFTDKLNIYDGKITYNDFDINENLSFCEQEYSYKEDILQIKFGSRYTLDVGWLPEFDPKGYFVVCGIQDYNWEKPVVKKKCKSLDELKKIIEEVAGLLSLKNSN